ncbi:aldolase [Sinomonas albida]|uniref:aldolase n=1 Tax=Sinomonas albida TaxID=369942 RepID=UPI00301A57EE
MRTDTALSALARDSGAFAMLALDQREALRDMMAAHCPGPVSDGQITRFKLEAARILTPHASAVLIDRQFALDQAIATGAVSAGCSLIAAADLFEAAHGETVGRTRIDLEADPAAYAALGVKAMKLLIIYRPDEDPEPRLALARQFIDRCRSAGLASIIEPVSRRPRDGGPFDKTAGTLAAAAELGHLGADLYKAEVPFDGLGPEREVRAAFARLSELIDSQWVVLSSGVPDRRFPQTVAWACAEGASGFLAGRAVWASCLAAPHIPDALRTIAVDRLRRLCDTVDDAAA